MATSRVAIAGCRASTCAHRTDLYPDPDLSVLESALAEAGLQALSVSWDDPDFDWAAPVAVLVRSTWDSVDRPQEYLPWAKRVDEQTLLINPAEAIEWNLDKTYLQDLAAAQVPVVPTQWVWPGSDSRPSPGENWVVKPAISAGGRDTAWYGQGQEAAAEAHVARLLDQGQIVMVQPYLRSVSEPGEIDLIYIDGEYSHSVRKGPLLELGAGIQQRPWERMTWLGLAEPTDAELALANKAMAFLNRRFGTLAYGRVDVLDWVPGRPVVLEVELIDPNLSLTDFPAASRMLARAVAELLRR